MLGEQNSSSPTCASTRSPSRTSQEHAQSLLKYAMSSQHEEVHCASWPVFPSELPHHSLSRSSNAAVLTAYAVETGTFVVSASSFLSPQNLEKVFGEKEKILSLGGGYTTILDPEGRTLALAEPDKNEIIYAHVDLDACYKARSMLDPTGHYSRTDVFQVLTASLLSLRVHCNELRRRYTST